MIKRVMNDEREDEMDENLQQVRTKRFFLIFYFLRKVALVRIYHDCPMVGLSFYQSSQRVENIRTYTRGVYKIVNSI